MKMRRSNVTVSDVGSGQAEVYSAQAYPPCSASQRVQVIASDPRYAEYLLCKQLRLTHDDERTVFIMRGADDEGRYEVINVIRGVEVLDINGS